VPALLTRGSGLFAFGVLNITGVIVCHCNAVSDRRIHAEAGLGATTIEDIISRCAAGSDCGRCLPRVEKVLSVRRTTALVARAS
jgi:bacterioferritin-associated ferredoxin